MIPKCLTSFPSASTHGAALAAATHASVADTANVASLPLAVEALHTDGAQAYVVGGTSLWWSPRVHLRSLTPLSTGTAATWQL